MATETKHDPALLQNLLDAGCPGALVEQYFALERLGREKEQLGLLAAHRRWLLAEIHATQKCLDCLDFLLYQMRKENSNQERGKR